MFLLVLSLGTLITIFSWWPWAEVIFEVPKVFTFSLLVKALFLLFIHDLYKNPDRITKWKLDKKLTILIVTFLIWANLASILGNDPAKSYIGNFYRRDGLITLFDLVSFAFLISYFWKNKYRQLFSAVFWLSGFVLGAWSLGLFAMNKLELGNAATFGNPVFLAGFLSICLPISYYFLNQTKFFKYKYLLLVPQFLSIFVLSATSAILTLCLWLIFISWFKLKKTKIVLISFIVLFMVILSGFWVRDYITTNNNSLIAEGRFRIFVNLIRGVFEKPIAGYGWSNVDYAFQQGNWPIRLNNDVYVDKAHSHLLEISVTTGIVGLLLYLSTIVRLSQNLFKKYKTQKDLWTYTVVATLFLFLFHSQTNVISITEEMVFWFVVGLAL